MRTWLLGVTALLAATIAVACGGSGSNPADETVTRGPSPAPMTYAERPPLSIDPDGTYFATIETTKGTFRIRLRPDIAPETVNSFIFLAREGFYNGVAFHRVIPGFVAQGGDPTGTGSGGPGYTLPAEFSDTPFERGTVGLARAADPNSGGSQFFIAYGRLAALDGQYTIFGRVVEGMDVVNSLTPRDPDDPAAADIRPDTIIRITISEE